MYVKKSLMLWLVVCAVAIPFLLAGDAGAMYLTDGAKTVSPGVYDNPNDGMCVIGVAANGDMLVDPAITNKRDCDVRLVTGLTTTTACTVAGGSGNDGYKHVWSTSICMNGSASVSRVDLDNTANMCTAQGGTVVTTGKCIAHSWQYRGVKSDGSVVSIPSNSVTPTHGPQSTDGLGFCYNTMRMTTAYADPFTCPSVNNIASALLCSAGSGTYTGQACTTANAATACGNASNCVTANPAIGGFSIGSDGAYYASQATYDAGLGWAWDATNGRCNYTYGTKGYLNAALTNVAGATATVTLCGGGTVAAAAGACVDLTDKLNMGDCLAAGALWDNWIPTGTGVAPYAVDLTVSTTPDISTVKKLDATTSIAAGGGKFYSGTGSSCLKCHSDQSRSYMERDKPSYVKTGHKTAGDTVKFATIGSEWGLKGVQCEICHATGKPTAQDVGIVVYSNRTGTNAGLPRAASGHNQTEYGSHVNGVCYYCHGTNNSTPATVIPVAENAKNLNSISNQFLNSPHAKYSGSGATVEVVSKANYASTFVGYVCRSSNSVGGGSILTTYYDGTAAKKIPNLDTAANIYCTGTGTYGAGGFWVKEGEAATTANGVAVASSDQGNCMTCHDIHWSMGDATTGAEPLRRECATCHENSSSVTSAPQIDIAQMTHPKGSKTPWDTKYKESCSVCHMAAQAVENGTITQPLHLMRINTTATYTTMGATNMNLVGSEAFVDVDLACGQCHNGSVPGVMVIPTATLTTAARNIHFSQPTPTIPPVVSRGTVTLANWTVSFTDASTALSSVTVNWGDGVFSKGLAGDVFSHDYSRLWSRPSPTGPFVDGGANPNPRARLYTISHVAADPVKSSLVSKSTFTANVPQRFTIQGTIVTSSTSTTLLPGGATVSLKINGHTVKSAKGNTFTFSNMQPGAYTVSAYKYKSTFNIVTIPTLNSNVTVTLYPQ